MTVEGERILAALDEVRAFCVANANASVAARYARYFREGYDPYGIEQAAWQAKLEDWLERYPAQLGFEGCLDLGDRLFENGKYEEGSLAILLAARFREQLREDSFARLGRWLEFGVRNWAHCDFLCGEVLSPCLRKGQVPLAAMAGWREAPYRFKRRAVPVAMLGYLKDRPDLSPLLEFVRPMMLDGERVVHQGLGWFLRECWKVEHEPVEAFLLEWKDVSARLIFQYATEKMTPENKERFRRVRRGSPKAPQSES